MAAGTPSAATAATPAATAKARLGLVKIIVLLMRCYRDEIEVREIVVDPRPTGADSRI
jgi:hypothetical protein